MAKGQHTRDAEDQVKAQSIKCKDENLDGESLGEFCVTAFIRKDSNWRFTIHQADDERQKDQRE